MPAPDRQTSCSQPLFGGWHPGVMAALLLLVTLVAYGPALTGDFFLYWDDAKWTRDMEPLAQDVSGLWRIWSELGAVEQYYPLTATSFWMDRRLWGDWTLPYHVENVLLHAASAFLLGLLLRRLRVPGAWLAAFIIALHPVMVESVAWVTERKNVLSLPFFLGALIASAGFASWPERVEKERGRWWRAYLLTAVLFLAAILAKVSAFVFPAVLLLLCWWKKGTLSPRRDVLPMLPFFAVAIALSLVVHHVETKLLGSEGEVFDMSLAQHILVAGRVLCFHAGKLLAPVDVCAMYARWTPDPAVWWQWLFPAGVILAVVAAWGLRHRIGRGPVVALFYFAGSLFPLLGFFEVYGMAFTFVADRWVYLPSLGILVPTAVCLDRLARQVRPMPLRWGLLAAVPALLAGLTWQSAGRFRDERTLWAVTAEQNPACWAAFNNLGNLAAGEGRHEEAAALFRRALEADADNTHALNNLANALLNSGQAGEAVERFRELLERDPKLAVAHHNLGLGLLKLGRPVEAVEAFREALRLQPDLLPAHQQLGDLLLALGRSGEAEAQYLATLEVAPQDANALLTLGNLRIAQGRLREACDFYERALETSPADPVVLNNLAWLLATAEDETLRDGPRAVELAARAIQNAPERMLEYEQTLALAHAASGRFDEAAKIAGEAAAQAAAEGRGDLARILEAQRRQFLERGGR